MVYFEIFCYVMYYIVPEKCIGERFLEDCFYCYSQEIISAVTNRFPITSLEEHINNKNTCKMVCKMQCLKNGL